MKYRSLIILLLVAAPAGLAAQETGRNVWPEISLALKFSGFRSITHVTHAGDGSKRLFVTEQRGRVLVVKNGVRRTTPFLDITKRVSCCGERGLLSIAFPPDYAKKGYFYVNYTDSNGDTVVSRFRLSGDTDIADPRSEEIVLTIPQPFANHNGGQLAFGPDGYLYIGMGDGGSAGDPYRNGQNGGQLLGKLLRIDTETKKKPYGVPQDNPFVNEPGFRPEIRAWGLRNPWRFSFDSKTGDLFIADVGQNDYEEINFQPSSSRGGENYGWNIMEGFHCYNSKNCDRGGLVLPVAEYDHSQGCSVTGGMIYRGKEFTELQGIYFYGDYCSGRIWGLRRSGAEWKQRRLLDSGLSISTFGKDEEENLYVADYARGLIYKIESAKEP